MGGAAPANAILLRLTFQPPDSGGTKLSRETLTSYFLGGRGNGLPLAGIS
jgi:hypothetical protein